jgi:hypothetical protein
VSPADTELIIRRVEGFVHFHQTRGRRLRSKHEAMRLLPTRRRHVSQHHSLKSIAKRLRISIETKKRISQVASASRTPSIMSMSKPIPENSQHKKWRKTRLPFKWINFTKHHPHLLRRALDLETNGRKQFDKNPAENTQGADSVPERYLCQDAVMHSTMGIIGRAFNKIGWFLHGSRRLPSPDPCQKQIKVNTPQSTGLG